MIIETKKLKDLKPAPYNPRKSTERQEGNLKASLEKFGVVEPIIFNKQTGYIVGGHFRVRELKKLGFKEVECVIVDLNEADEKELNIRLNANTGEWDMDLLDTNFESEDLENWGLDLPNFESEDNDQNKQKDNSEYTQKVDIPTYEPKNEKPLFVDLYNSDYFKKLIEDIESSDVTKEEKEFLKLAATRHIVFNYSKIADTYAHSNSNMQTLMEDSALVIIDYNKAIELGFVKLGAEISKLYGKDYPENEE